MCAETSTDDAEKLATVLSRFEITGARTIDGKYLAFSVTEPLFCYERDTEEELNAVIADTIQSYAETFYEIEGFRVEIVSQPLEHDVPDVPIERIEPTSRLLPSFGDLLGNRQLASA